jgi:hypothetical protein
MDHIVSWRGMEGVHRLVSRQMTAAIEMKPRQAFNEASLNLGDIPVPRSLANPLWTTLIPTNSLARKFPLSLQHL